MTRFALSTLALSLALVAPAYAADCPGVFSNEVCDPNGTPICSLVGTTITCDLAPDGLEDFDTESYYVIKSGGNTEFRAYGFESDYGSEFCCEITVADGCAPGANPNTLYVYGAGRKDELNLVDTVNGWAMECSTSWVYGSDEDDEINGSSETSNVDRLYGETNSDTIRGREGSDYIYGGMDADTCYGDAGNDFIYLGSGADRAKGGTGQDTIYGEADSDQICGGADADTLYGGDADDQVTGEAAADTVSQGDAHTTGDTCETESAALCEVLVANMTCPW